MQRDDVNVDLLRGVAQAAGVLSMLEDFLRGE